MLASHVTSAGLAYYCANATGPQPYSCLHSPFPHHPNRNIDNLYVRQLHTLGIVSLLTTPGCPLQRYRCLTSQMSSSLTSRSALTLLGYSDCRSDTADCNTSPKKPSSEQQQYRQTASGSWPTSWACILISPKRSLTFALAQWIRPYTMQ